MVVHLREIVHLQISALVRMDIMVVIALNFLVLDVMKTV